MSRVTQPANSFFPPCVLVFVQLNVFARKAAPDVSKGAGEGEYGGERAKKHETGDTSDERRIEKLGGKLTGASG